MSRFFAALVRHGDYQQLAGAPSAHQPFPLNPAGEGHAREAGRLLLEFCGTHNCQLYPVLDSSRMQRAWQTAELIAHQAGAAGISGVQIAEFDALAERGVGCAANLTTAQIEEILHADSRFSDPPSNWKADSHYRLPLQGAESLLEAGERVAEHLRRRMAELPFEQRESSLKVFVGHGAAFRHAAYHLGVMAFAQIAKLSMYHGQPIILEYHADGSWQHLAGKWKVRGATSEYKD